MKKLALTAALCLILITFATPGAVYAVTCTPTGFYRDGINMTAALIDPAFVTGTVDATGCNIGVYYSPGSTGVIDNAEIYGANYFGVVNRQGNVTITDSEIHDIGETPFNGTQHGVAVYYATSDTGSASAQPQCVTGSTSGKIDSNEIYDYQKGGIVANCRGTEVNVTNNIVTGLSSVPFIAQNGIQFGYGGKGMAKANTVNGNWYTGANWSSTGILIFESSDVMVQGNTVENNQVGVGVESWCWFVASASNNKVVQNIINGSEWGVSVGAIDFNGYSTCDPLANNNKIVNNVITTVAGAEGISVWTYDDLSSSYVPTIYNNKVINNTISGYTTPVADYGTKTKVHANEP
jgi:hypothetical protein